MTPHNAARVVALVIGCYLLYFDATWLRGLVGPDEPRYASIANDMAVSGDCGTPRLAGEPWFEKPSLLYWIGAAFDSLGDHATRVPVALLSVAFLVLFHWRMRVEFGENEADFSTAILATSAGWISFSQVGVFDLPLSVALGAAMLALVRWADSDTPGAAPSYFGTHSQSFIRWCERRIRKTRKKK